jgi:hypothetical protein
MRPPLPPVVSLPRADYCRFMVHTERAREGNYFAILRADGNAARERFHGMSLDVEQRFVWLRGGDGGAQNTGPFDDRGSSWHAALTCAGDALWAQAMAFSGLTEFIHSPIALRDWSLLLCEAFEVQCDALICGSNLLPAMDLLQTQDPARVVEFAWPLLEQEGSQVRFAKERLSGLLQFPIERAEQDTQPWYGRSLEALQEFWELTLDHVWSAMRKLSPVYPERPERIDELRTGIAALDSIVLCCNRLEPPASTRHGGEP